MAANNRMMDSTARLELHVACSTKCLYTYCIPRTTAVLDHIITNTLNSRSCTLTNYHSDVDTIEFELFSAQFTFLYTLLIYHREGRQTTVTSNLSQVNRSLQNKFFCSCCLLQSWETYPLLEQLNSA